MKRKNLNRDEKDHLIEFVHGEQEADRNWYSPIVDVQSIEDAVQWLKDNEYDWKKMVLKFRQEQWDDDPYTQQDALDQQADYDMQHQSGNYRYQHPY